MRHSTQLRFCVIVALFGLIFSSFAALAQSKSSGRGRKYKVPPATSRIEVTVLRDIDGKPIANAAVIFHAMLGEKDKGNMELKTNEDGKAIIDVMPIGDTVRLQIIAKGFQTFGDDYKIDKASMEINLRMKRPGEQYSIYKNHPAGLHGGENPNTANPDKPEASANKPQPK